MAKNVSATVSGAGFIASFWVALDKAARKRGLNDEQIHAALKDDSPLIERFADLIVETVGKMRQKVFRISLNYDESLETKTATGFNYANPNLTDANFKKVVQVGQGDGEAILVNFSEYVESDDAVARLEKIGLRPGIPKELADLSKSNPNSTELAACLPVVALGDSWQYLVGRRGVAGLDGDVSYRKLRLYWWGDGWDDYWWFLAFRK